MLALNKLQDATEKEVNQGTVFPKDYTVVITQDPHTESLDDLPGVYYAWVENVCSQEAVELLNPDTGEVDEN